MTPETSLQVTVVLLAFLLNIANSRRQKLTLIGRLEAPFPMCESRTQGVILIGELTWMAAF